MPESLSAELVTLRDKVAALAVQDLIPLRDNPDLNATERARLVRGASRDAGIYATTQPASLGGTEASALALVVVRDTLSQAGVGHLAGLYGSSPGVLAGVGEPLRTTHLLPSLRGDKRGGFAFTEPADAPRRSWAIVDGETLIVNGQKSYVTGGADADFLTALVEVVGRGPAMVVIDVSCPGVTLTKRFGTIDGSHHAAFSFSDVRVPLGHMIGSPGDGMSRAIGKISEVRLGIAADCVGTMGWVIALLTSHLLDPARHKQSAGAQERARLRYGEQRVAAYAARSVLYRTARLVDSGENAVNECIAAKAFATEAAGKLVDTAIQLVGGEALVEGHPLEALFRRLRSLRLAEGETDQLYVNVSRGRLDLGVGRL